MIENIIGRAPAGLILFCTILAFVVPFGFYKVNKAIHNSGDPPWKKEETTKEDNSNK